MIILKKTVRSGLYLCLAAVLILALCCCGNDGETSSGTDSSAAPSESTGSLEPVTQFFPGNFITFKPTSGDHPEINVKGNAAVTLTDGETVQFDPNTYENIRYPVSYASADGVTVGSEFSELAAVYGLAHGKCVAVDMNNEAVDVDSIGADSEEMTVFAIIELNADGTFKYVAPSRVVGIVEGFEQGRADYREEAAIGDDFLIIEAKLLAGAVIQELTVIHYTF